MLTWAKNVNPKTGKGYQESDSENGKRATISYVTMKFLNIKV